MLTSVLATKTILQTYKLTEIDFINHLWHLYTNIYSTVYGISCRYAAVRRLVYKQVLIKVQHLLKKNSVFFSLYLLTL